MMLIRILPIAAACFMGTAHTAANAWFFFFIPGAVTSAIGDKLTGSEGDHCVGADAVVGSKINVAGASFEVKSLSGTSMRCTNAAIPIRARLEPWSAPAFATVPLPAPVVAWQPERPIS